MARARNIKPSFFKNEILGEADPLLGLLFISLWTLADKAGRLEDRPLRIKAETFPYRENIDVNGYLTQLVSLDFIRRYEVAGKRIIEVINFKKHQTPHSTEKASELPEMPEPEPLTVNTPLNNESPAVNGHINVLIPDSSNTDSLLLNPDSLNPPSLIADDADKSAPKQKKGQALTDDWALPKQWGEWALSAKPNWTIDYVRNIADEFKDHWLATANQAKSKRADWFATWRNWVRRQNDKPSFMTKAQRMAENSKKAGDDFVNGTNEREVKGEIVND